MEVFQWNEKKVQDDKEFMSDIQKAELRPALYIGFDKDNEPVLYLGALTWREVAYLKMSLDAHFMKDWMGE